MSIIRRTGSLVASSSPTACCCSRAAGVVAASSARVVLTEGALSEHWGPRVRVLDDPEGGIVVIPVRARTESKVPDERRASH